MRVAIVHDWLDVFTGSERVVGVLLDIFPEADVFSMVDFLKPADRGFLKGKTVHTSFLQKLPLARCCFRKMLPLMPLAIESFNLKRYDLILTSSHAVAKGVLSTPEQLHICYLHARNLKYAYDDRELYPAPLFLRWPHDICLSRLRVWDAVATHRPDVFIANSRYVKRWYEVMHGVSSSVIHPPVETSRFKQHYCADKDDYYITVGRLAPYKRTDIVVRAFNTLGRRLLVVGAGADEAMLRHLARPNIEFLGFQSGQRVADLVSRAKAFVFAGKEDFGIALVEAQATGTPVIAFNGGGAAETVLHAETGVLFSPQTPEALVDAVQQFEAGKFAFSPERARQHAESFSNERFIQEYRTFVMRQWENFHKQQG